MRYCLKSCVVSWFLLLATGVLIAQEPVDVSLRAPAVTHTGDPINLDILTTQISDLDTIFLQVAYEASEFRYDQLVLTSTLMEDASALINSSVAGQLTISMNLAGVDGINGEGVLVSIRFEAIGQGGSTGEISVTQLQLGDTIANAIPFDLLNSKVDVAFEAPLPVALAEFSAIVKADAVLLKWRTTDPTGSLGFHVYRRRFPEQTYHRANTELIQPDNTTVNGKTYHFVDDEVDTGEVSYYYLEEVSLTGENHRSHIIRVGKRRLPSVWGRIKQQRM